MPSPDRAPAILFIHGWGSSQQSYLERARALAELGFIGMTFDLRGHGMNPRPRTAPTRKEFFNDVVAAYDFLAGQAGVDPQRIGVVGSSFGGYLGALLTTKRDVKWLALRAPADIRDAALGSGVEALRGFAGEVLLVESENDTVIPRAVVQAYRAAVGDEARVTYVRMQGAAHELSEPAWRAQFLEILTDWFGRRR